MLSFFLFTRLCSASSLPAVWDLPPLRNFTFSPSIQRFLDSTSTNSGFLLTDRYLEMTTISLPTSVTTTALVSSPSAVLDLPANLTFPETYPTDFPGFGEPLEVASVSPVGPGELIFHQDGFVFGDATFTFPSYPSSIITPQDAVPRDGMQAASDGVAQAALVLLGSPPVVLVTAVLLLG